MLDAGCYSPPAEFTADSSTSEHERIHAESFTSLSYEQLAQVLGRYEALWQLPGSALLLSEQLLAGLPCGWCCNNPGCSNSDGPSERALVGGKGCKCAGCRTARCVLGTRLTASYFGSNPLVQDHLK
jgi:hypothetical protein